MLYCNNKLLMCYLMPKFYYVPNVYDHMEIFSVPLYFLLSEHFKVLFPNISIVSSIQIKSSSSSSCRAASIDIPDPLSPLFPIVYRLWQVFWTTSHILT